MQGFGATQTFQSKNIQPAAGQTPAAPSDGSYTAIFAKPSLPAAQPPAPAQAPPAAPSPMELAPLPKKASILPLVAIGVVFLAALIAVIVLIIRK